MNRSETNRSKTHLTTHRRKLAIRCAAWGLAALLASGCMPDAHKEVAKYRGVLDGPKPAVYEFKPTQSQPLTLEAAFLLANKNDEQLASQGETYLQTLIDKERQFDAWLPTLSLAPSSQFTKYHNIYTSATPVLVVPAGSQTPVPVIKPGKVTEGITGNVNAVPVTAGYTNLNPVQNVAAVRRAGFTADQNKALLLDLQQTTLLNLATTYYAVLNYERSVVVLLNSAQLQNERVRDMEGRLKAGIAKPLDVAQSQAQAAATRVQLIQAQNNVRTSRIMLAFLAGAPVQDAKLEDTVAVPEKLASQDDAVKAAVKARYDVQAAEAAVESARQNLQATIATYYPSASINLEYWFHNQAANSFSQPALWSGLIQFNIPLFIATIDANVRTAYSQVRQAWLAEQRTLRLVSEQVRMAYENLEGSRLRILDLEIEVIAANDAVQQAISSYKAGLATNLDVLTAIDALNQAELGLVTEQLNYKLYYVTLVRTQGLLNLPNSPVPPTTGPSSRPSVEELLKRHSMTGHGAGSTTGRSPATQPASMPFK